MHNMMTTWCARVLLALFALGFAASAQASTIYNFTFTSFDDHSVVMSGSFTTNGAAVDPGYETILALTVDEVRVPDGTVYAGPFAMTLVPSAAYNPVTDAFVNHASGSTFPDIGHLEFQRPDFQLNISGDSFNDYGFLRGFVQVPGDIKDLPDAFLTVTAAAAPPVPEPTSLVLLGTGLLGAVVSRRRSQR